MQVVAVVLEECLGESELLLPLLSEVFNHLVPLPPGLVGLLEPEEVSQGCRGQAPLTPLTPLPLRAPV